MCTIDTFGGFVSLVGFNLSYEDLVDIKRNNFEVLLLVGVVSCPKVETEL
jgi:uncharacterized membrane protein